MMKFNLKFPTLSTHGKAVLGLSLVQALTVVALEIAISVIFIGNVDINTNDKEEGSGKSIAVYLFIYIFTQFYQFGIILNALWDQNTIQVFAHVLFCACMVGFSIFQYFQIKEALTSLGTFKDDMDKYMGIFNQLVPLLIASIVILGVCCVAFAYLAFKLYLEFGWKIYKKIGADPRKREMYRTYQILVMLLKFALYFFIAFAIQFLVLVLKTTDPEFALTIVAIFASFLAAFLVVFGVRRENKWVLLLWTIFLLLAIAYFAFKIGRIYDETQTFKYVGSGKFLTLFATLGLIVLLLTLAYTIMCFMNFGKGLKEHLTSDNPSRDDDDRRDSKQGRTMVLA